MGKRRHATPLNNNRQPEQIIIITPTNNASNNTNNSNKITQNNKSLQHNNYLALSSPSQPPSEPPNQPPTHYSSYTKQFLPYGNTPISISIFSTFPLFVPSLANFYLTVFCIFEGVFLPLTLSLARSLRGFVGVLLLKVLLFVSV